MAVRGTALTIARWRLGMRANYPVLGLFQCLRREGRALSEEMRGRVVLVQVYKNRRPEGNDPGPRRLTRSINFTLWVGGRTELSFAIPVPAVAQARPVLRGASRCPYVCQVSPKNRRQPDSGVASKHALTIVNQIMQSPPVLTQGRLWTLCCDTPSSIKRPQNPCHCAPADTAHQELQIKHRLNGVGCRKEQALELEVSRAFRLSVESIKYRSQKSPWTGRRPRGHEGRLSPWFGPGWTGHPASTSALFGPHRRSFTFLRISQGTHGSPALSLQGRHAV